MEKRENKPSLIYCKKTTKPTVILLDLSTFVMSGQLARPMSLRAMGSVPACMSLLK